MENDAVLKALSSLENANIFLERTVYYDRKATMTVYAVLDLCGGRLNFISRRGGSEVHSKTQVRRSARRLMPAHDIKSSYENVSSASSRSLPRTGSSFTVATYIYQPFVLLMMFQSLILRKYITEYTDIVYVYGLCDGSTVRAVAEYKRRFPNRRVPYRRVFTVYGVGWKTCLVRRSSSVNTCYAQSDSYQIPDAKQLSKKAVVFQCDSSHLAFTWRLNSNSGYGTSRTWVGVRRTTCVLMCTNIVTMTLNKLQRGSIPS
ncbi:hypothetical protein ANN_02048 [Periplaneta americana]|uniref:DUF4817 domain-containing protein n=1 Tax=Periplaneta americana TaxID=6978 RepID=A0ABQ8TY97_PERAM|nr:hypothetical protein ANN_02048 [Periplaneta americana]